MPSLLLMICIEFYIMGMIQNKFLCSSTISVTNDPCNENLYRFTAIHGKHFFLFQVSVKWSEKEEKKISVYSTSEKPYCYRWNLNSRKNYSKQFIDHRKTWLMQFVEVPKIYFSFWLLFLLLLLVLFTTGSMFACRATLYQKRVYLFLAWTREYHWSTVSVANLHNLTVVRRMRCENMPN